MKRYNDMLQLIKILLVLWLKLAYNFIYYTIMYVFLFITLIYKLSKTSFFILSILLFKLTYQLYTHYTTNIFISTQLLIYTTVYKFLLSAINTLKIYKLFLRKNFYFFTVLNSNIFVLKPRNGLNFNSFTRLFKFCYKGIANSLFILSLLFTLLASVVAIIILFHISNFLNVESFISIAFLYSKSLILNFNYYVHSEIYRFYESYLFLSPESYLNLKGDWFIRLNIFFPIATFYSDWASLVTHLNEWLLTPLKNFFFSLSLYAYYQNLSHGFTEPEFSLLFRLSPFYSLWSSPALNFTDYFFECFVITYLWPLDSYSVSNFNFIFQILYAVYEIFLILTYIFAVDRYFLALACSTDLLYSLGHLLLSTYSGLFVVLNFSLGIVTSLVPVAFSFLILNWIAIIKLLCIIFQKCILLFLLTFVPPLQAIPTSISIISTVTLHFIFFISSVISSAVITIFGSLTISLLLCLRLVWSTLFYTLSWPLLILISVLYTTLSATAAFLFEVPLAFFFDSCAYFCVEVFEVISLLFCLISFPIYFFFAIFQSYFFFFLNILSGFSEFNYYFFNSDLFFFDFKLDTPLWFSTFAYLCLVSLLTLVFFFSKSTAYAYLRRSAIFTSSLSEHYLSRLGFAPSFTSRGNLRFEIFRTLDFWIAASHRGLSDPRFLSLFPSRSWTSSLNSASSITPTFNTGKPFYLWGKFVGALRFVLYHYNLLLLRFMLLLYPELSLQRKKFSSLASQPSLLFKFKRFVAPFVRFFLIGSIYEVDSGCAQTKPSILGGRDFRKDFLEPTFLGSSTFSLFFAFPWLAGTTTYEYLFWLHSSEVWRIQAGAILRQTTRSEESAFSSSTYSFNSRLLSDFANPHLAFKPENTNIHLQIHKYLKLSAQSEGDDIVRVGRRFFWTVNERDFLFNTLNSRQLEFGRMWRWLYLKFTDFERYYANQDMVADDPGEIYYQEISWYTIPGWFRLMPLGLRKLFFGFLFPLLGNFTFAFEFLYTIGDDNLEQDMVNDIALAIEVMRSNKEPFRVKYNIYETFTNHKFFQLRQVLNTYLWHAKIMDYIWTRWRQRQFPNFFKVFEEAPSLFPTHNEFNSKPFWYTSDLETYDFSSPRVYNLMFKEWVFPIEKLNYWTKGVAFKSSPVTYELLSPFALANEFNRSANYDLYRRLNYFWQDAMFVAAIDFEPSSNFGHWALNDVLYRAFYAQFYYKYVSAKQTYSFAITDYEQSQLLKKLRWRRFWDVHTFRKFRWRMRFHTKPVEKWTTRLLFFLNSSKRLFLNEMSIFDENRLISFTNSAYQIFFAQRSSELAWLAVDFLRQPSDGFLFRWLDFLWRFLLFKITTLLQLFYQFHMPLGRYAPWALWSAQGWAWNFRAFSSLDSSLLPEQLIRFDAASLELYVHYEDAEDVFVDSPVAVGLWLPPTTDALLGLSLVRDAVEPTYAVYDDVFALLNAAVPHNYPSFFETKAAVFFPNPSSMLINAIPYPQPLTDISDVPLLPSRTYIVLTSTSHTGSLFLFLNSARFLRDAKVDGQIDTVLLV